MLLAGLGTHAPVPVSVNDISAPLLPRRPHRHVRLGEQAHHLEPPGQRRALELVMLARASSLLAQPIIDSRC